MNNFIAHRLRQMRNMGLGATSRVAADRAGQAIGSSFLRLKAAIVPSGISSWAREGVPTRIVPVLALAQDGAEAPWIAHVFDLLGSGPKEVALGPVDPIEDLPQAWHGRYRILKGLLHSAYKPIDWQLDAKSGHRWSARQWSQRVAYGKQLGVDVKWPWELARLQHLPALAGRLSTAPEQPRKFMEREIRAQIVDFIMQNPPGFGVNWVCAMDVAIRVANISIAVDLARAAGTEFDDAFLRLVSATMRDHARHIARNLEWGASLCSNHYLADLIGLLFAAASLPEDEETSDWIGFSGREISLQLRGQFHAEGTNFEASTCYHRLSSEMMLYGAGLMLWIAADRPKAAAAWFYPTWQNFRPDPGAPALVATANSLGVQIPFGESDSARFYGMSAFTEALLRRDGSIPQIGDNDNGRFLRLSYGRDPYADLLSHVHLPAALSSLFPNTSGPAATPEARWIRAWIGQSHLLPGNPQPPLDMARYRQFPEFGLYVWNRATFRLTLRCGTIGQNGNGGHAHSDQLSITLDVHGYPVFIDPGTGLYTPDPELRNCLRSASSHNCVVVDGAEPNEWLPGRWGLFSMKDKSAASIVRSGEKGAQAEHRGYGTLTRRTIAVEEGGFTVVDETGSAKLKAFSQVILDPGVKFECEGNTCRIDIQMGGPSVVLRTENPVESRRCTASPCYGVTIPTWAISWAIGSAVFSIE